MMSVATGFPRIIARLPLLLLPCCGTLCCGGNLGSQEPLEESRDALTCSGSDCPVYPVRSSPSAAQALEGGDGGEPFGALCREDQVLIGIRAIVNDSLWGIGTNCGSLELSPTGSNYAVNVLPLDQLSLFGAVGIEPAPPVIEYSCPPKMVVTAVSWTYWQPFEGLQQVLRQMQLTCSDLSVGPGRQLLPGSTTALLLAGTAADGDSPVLQSCSEQGAVSGFTGRSGAAIDALSTSCVTLSVDAP